jgi:phosphoribosylaminoimidazolecarboxamide formyltransferase / IMP cyclohydrolase
MKRALLSVSNKENIVELAHFLISKNVEIISTGGTAKLLAENNIKITPISEVTGNPEAFGGRMKSISFQVGSALLYRRDHADDQVDAKKLNIDAIDIVVCNLYPFVEVSKKTDDLPTLIENIDIGGPTMIRAAAKNYRFVSILTSPDQYSEFISQYDKVDEEFNFQLAKQAFTMTAEYDQYIINTLDQDRIPVASTNSSELRYGENPHQKAWVLPWKNTTSRVTLQSASKLQGKELSYNNLVDADAGWKCTSELHELYQEKFITTIIKHANPCGVAISDDGLSSLTEAWACDPISSFGSIISFNKKVTKEIANWLSDKFVEIIIAPEFEADATEIFNKKKNLRILQTPNKPKNSKEYIVKSINGALLVQQEDEFHSYEFEDVTATKIPTEFNQLKQFGMIVNKYLKSNGIALVANRNKSLVMAGAGMGQPNRLDSLKMLAGPRALNLDYKMDEVVLISDAFFPFRDSIDVAAKMGIKYIIQPGGSIRDEEVITACNEHAIGMNFTRTRHFRH